MQKLSNILIYRLGSLGDAVIALPCFHRIADSFPHAKRFLLTNRPVSIKAPPMELILHGSNLVHGLVTYELGIRDPRQLLELRAELRTFDFDTAVYLNEPHSRFRVLRDIVFLHFCGINQVLCAPLRADELYHRLDAGSGLIEYEAERLTRCLASLGPIDLSDRRAWDLQLTAEEVRVASEFLTSLGDREFLVVNVGGELATKDWGNENWVPLLRELGERLPRLGLVFLGSADEARRSEELGRNWKAPVLNGCGKLTPRESAAVLDRALMFLGHDSGPMHLAASRGIRCVALFGSNSLPRIWHPYGVGHEVIHDTSGIEGISQQRVLDAVCRVVRRTFSSG
jgi:ADP-heptose:LPS heptosyltransferase